jgi:hypothetical protein
MIGVFRNLRDSGLLRVFPLIVVIAFASGWQGLVNLFWAFLFDCWIILQVLPFFKWDLVILGLKMLWGLL